MRLAALDTGARCVSTGSQHELFCSRPLDDPHSRALVALLRSSLACWRLRKSSHISLRQRESCAPTRARARAPRTHPLCKLPSERRTQRNLAQAIEKAARHCASAQGEYQSESCALSLPLTSGKPNRTDRPVSTCGSNQVLLDYDASSELQLPTCLVACLRAATTTTTTTDYSTGQQLASSAHFHTAAKACQCREAVRYLPTHTNHGCEIDRE